MNAKGSAAHIHMAGTTQTVIYASHHHPDSAFNPDLEKNITFFWLQQLIHSLSLLPHNTKDCCTLSVHFGAASPSSSALTAGDVSLCSQQLRGDAQNNLCHQPQKMKINWKRPRLQKASLGAHTLSLPKLKEAGKPRMVSHT